MSAIVDIIGREIWIRVAPHIECDVCSKAA